MRSGIFGMAIGVNWRCLRIGFVATRRDHDTRSAIEKRQPDCEHGADARSAIDFDRPAVILNHLLGDIETETGSTLTLFSGEVWIENLAHLRGINA